MENCIFINDKSENLDKCKFNKKYGNYCFKHRSKYLLDENGIIIDKFTNHKKDYLLIDLMVFCKKNNIKTSKKENKDFYFNKVKEYIFLNKKYELNVDKISLIQNFYKNKLLKRKKEIEFNNTEDFYTYDPLNEIDPKYFYYYKDKNNFNWGFDIRSLIKLIDMNYPNPYTTEKIPDNIIKEVKLKIKGIKKSNDYENIEEVILRDRKTSIKQRAVDLFSDIELSGYSCEINWFFNLSGRRLKELYRQLEDLWNYRAQLTQESKRNICPPNGLIFTTPVSEVLHYNCKEDLQELILNDVSKFKNALNLSDKKLGYMYFIIGLSVLSPPCYLTHQDWLSFIQ